MKLGISKSDAAKLAPLACFELGQRVTEIGAAIAYADYFARRGLTGTAVRDLSAGVHTAALAADRLGNSLKGAVKSEVKKFENDLRSFNESVRKRWVKGSNPLNTADIVEIQRKTSQLRKKAMDIWSQIRLTCPSGTAAAKSGKVR